MSRCQKPQNHKVVQAAAQGAVLFVHKPGVKHWCSWELLEAVGNCWELLGNWELPSAATTVMIQKIFLSLYPDISKQ